MLAWVAAVPDAASGFLAAQRCEERLLLLEEQARHITSLHRAGYPPVAAADTPGGAVLMGGGLWSDPGYRRASSRSVL
jgi:hypothetical protein